MCRRLGSLSPAVAAWLCSVASPGQDPLTEQIQRTLQQARAPLLAALETAAEPGIQGLLCLAAIHDGVPPDDPVLAKALTRLAAARIDGTYALSLRLLVAEACATLPERERIARSDCKTLLKNRDGGAFTYRDDTGHWDLSNTQYAALGLRAAASLGADIGRKVWLELADAAMDAQRDSGAFTYRPEAGEETLSMTAAGICVLAICRQALAQPGRHLPEVDRRIDRAWAWLAAHAARIGDVGQPWCHYAHYGFERAAILCDVEQVGAVDWYRQGAAMFVAEQRADGGWSTARAPVVNGISVLAADDTAFAVLFLRRKFQKVAGPITAARTIVLAALTVLSPAAEIDACVAGLLRRGKPAVPDILQALRGEVPVQRRAALAALRAIAGADFGIDAEQGVEVNAAALRRAELWYLRNR